MHKHIVLLFGDDPFAVRETVDRWKKAFTEKHGDINIDIFEGKTPAHQIIEATQTMPFLGEKRLVIVKDFLAEQDSEEQKKMAERFGDIPDSTVVLFWENSQPDKRTSLFKALQKSARTEEFKPLVGDDLTRWIIKTVEERGAAIDWQTATYLASLLPPDTWQLHNEIEKLLLYVMPSPGQVAEPITKDTIDSVVTAAHATTVFKLTDALGQRRSDEAIRHLHTLIEKGEEIPMIWGMLVRQIRMLIQIRELSQAGQSPASIAATIKQHPYAVSTMVPQSKNFTLSELKKLFARLLSIDLRLKTGAFSYTATDPRAYLLELETFLVESSGKSLPSSI